jgi:menaquinone-dependent protoporphyrinogen oxidase
MTCQVPVFYATTEGQTKRIAGRLAEMFRERGFVSRAVNVTSAAANGIDWSEVCGAVIGASLHGHRHQAEAAAFAKAHAAQLNRCPTAFFSVSLSAASEHAGERAEAERIAAEFPRAAGWYPDVTRCVAGRLAYTSYGAVKRLIMKWIASREGRPTDTSRDYEFTNWHDVRQLADDLTRVLHARSARRGAA